MIAWIAQIEYYFYIEIVKERKNMLHESELEKKFRLQMLILILKVYMKKITYLKSI